MSAEDMRARLFREMEKVFADHRKHIEHNRRVMEYAEEIQAAEGGSASVVAAAAILHDIGIPEARRKHGSSAAPYQETEGPPIAREILERTGFDPEDTDHVCRIVGSHHSAKDIDTIEFRAVWDADWLVNLPSAYPQAGKEELQAHIGRIFKTDAGKRMADAMFLS